MKDSQTALCFHDFVPEILEKVRENPGKVLIMSPRNCLVSDLVSKNTISPLHFM